MTLETHAIEFLAVAATAARLKEAGIYKEVLGALDTAALKDYPQTPAAAVLPLTDDAAEDVAPKIGATQRYKSIIAVQTMLSAPNDRSGTRAHNELSEILGEVRALISGWKPPGSSEVMQFRRGRLLRVDGGRVEWRDEYELLWWAGSAGVSVDLSEAGKPGRLQT